MKADIAISVFIDFAFTTDGGFVIHVVIIVLSIAPEWIIGIVRNGSRVVDFSRRTCGNTCCTHDNSIIEQTRNTFAEVDGDMRCVVAAPS